MVATYIKSRKLCQCGSYRIGVMTHADYTRHRVPYFLSFNLALSSASHAVPRVVIYSITCLGPTNEFWNGMLPELTTIVAIIYKMLSNYLDVILNEVQSLEHRLELQ